MKSFEELKCWQKIASLRKKLSALVKAFPTEEKYRLVDQITRASRSATANIAEGYGRFHYQEFIQFCRHSRGSLYEIVDHLIVACDEGLISEQSLKELKAEIHECLAILNGFINYLSEAKTSNKADEPDMQYETLIDNQYLIPDNYYPITDNR
jgi:four helix bundle protein